MMQMPMVIASRRRNMPKHAVVKETSFSTESPRLVDHEKASNKRRRKSPSNCCGHQRIINKLLDDISLDFVKKIRAITDSYHVN